ncbi:hypothetical protein NicSoilB8_46760 (plasmid) [Arthrobacter sp. NicSoilB8]|nr:hypothetical protein NicSoilB8_46760 [Arthrobacter sp. NicSoilB8]
MTKGGYRKRGKVARDNHGGGGPHSLPGALAPTVRSMVSAPVRGSHSPRRSPPLVTHHRERPNSVQALHRRRPDCEVFRGPSGSEVSESLTGCRTSRAHTALLTRECHPQTRTGQRIRAGGLGAYGQFRSITPLRCSLSRP